MGLTWVAPKSHSEEGFGSGWIEFAGSCARAVSKRPVGEIDQNSFALDGRYLPESRKQAVCGAEVVCPVGLHGAN
jgi:hypothetical protein